MRSPTAADIARSFDGIDTDFAGLSRDADEQIGTEHIQWADVIFVMEPRQKKKLTASFGPALRNKQVISLGIPDKFRYMQPELVALLTPKLRAALAP
ncbi:MAG: phosphotyrosine protein phosphatase [Pseudomonadota bacterium]